MLTTSAKDRKFQMVLDRKMRASTYVTLEMDVGSNMNMRAYSHAGRRRK